MKIRPVRDEDYAAIARLRRQTIRTVNAKDYAKDVIESWSAEVGAEHFRKGADGKKRWVAVEREKIIGFCEHTHCEISRMYVHKDHLRKGVGSRLLEATEASLKKKGCKEIMIESTVTAKDFYEKNGYEVLEKTVHRKNESQPIYRMSKKIR